MSKETYSGEHLTEARATIRELRAENAKLKEAAQLAINGYRRWKRNQKRGGDRNEADHGLTDLGQGIWDLSEIITPPDLSDIAECPDCGMRHLPGANSLCSA